MYKSDLPLWQDPSARFTPWVIALMVYVATVACLIHITIRSGLSQWDQDFANKITIEIPPTIQSFGNTGVNLEDMQSNETIELLRQTPGIKAFRKLSRAEIIQLIEPWFGKQEATQSLPLSTLIDIEVVEPKTFPLDALRKNVIAKVPSAKIESHLNWKEGLFNIAYTVKMVSLAIVLLIFAAAVLTIIFATQTSLIIHKPIIHILHLMGAKNSYISKQFQMHTMSMGIKGGFAGILFSTVTVLGFEKLIEHIDTQVFGATLSMWDIWAVSVMVPVCVIIFMIFSARFTSALILNKLYK